MSALDELAQAAATTSWTDAPEDVRRRTLDLVGDVVAVCALGSGRAELAALGDSFATATPEGPATAIGTSRGWPAASAAFLNGCSVAADQLQDGHRLARGHPASHTTPAALAIAETIGASTAELLSAVLAGYEVGARLGVAMGGTPDGVHDIGTWGQVAASAAVARLLAPNDAPAMRRAIELSAAAVLLTDAGTVFGGHSGSHAFLGLSVQHGLTAAQAAVAGLAPRAGSLERHFLRVAAAQPVGLDLGLSNGRFGRWQITGGYLKRFPTCAHLHGVNDAVDELIGRGVTGADVAAVTVDAFAGAARFDTVADDELAARFSVPTTVALALRHGRLDESVVTDELVRAVRPLAETVTVRHDPALDAGYPAGRPARVTVVLRDGRTESAEAGRPHWDAESAPEPGGVRAKRDRLLASRFGDPRARVIGDVLDHLPDRDVPALTAALRAAAG